MATLEEVSALGADRRKLIKTISYITIFTVVMFGYFYITFGFINFIGKIHPKLYILYIPSSIIAISSFRWIFRFTNYWKLFRVYLALITIVVGGMAMIDYLEDWYYKFDDLDYYFVIFIATGFIFRVFIRPEETRSKIASYLFGSAVLGVIVALTFAYHFFFFEYIIIHPKANLTLKNTIVTTSDIYDLVGSFQSKTGSEQIEMSLDPFMQILNRRGILVLNSTAVLPVNNTDIFRRKHADALFRIDQGQQINNFFFPSGYYKYSTSYLIDGYYLKNIHVKFNQEFGHDFELRFLFQKYGQNEFYQCISTDRDSVDATFTASIKLPGTPAFDVIGNYHFKNNPKELKRGVTALSVTYSNRKDLKPSLFSFFKPDIF
ncbi:hypothetical protein [Pedobacter duraquae]|uniref:Uncharacterized protein n=1 Tax=Pedobacter duraquae TaxID=425511 RepID=A0A4V3C2R2_9SPHI|nr:hypothetical protein [Pedobacter duraquae]TDO19349.1 hypothetical protein CLV32_4589 [Pedobacter duraquae]